ncbi:KIN14E, partial [Symbiodinium pilosum]
DDLSALPNDLPAARLLVPEIREVESLRRQVHNAIEDIKGHLRVFCRIRPLNDKERQNNDEEVVKVVDMMRLEVSQGASYSFDGVFAPGSQEEVFEDCKGLVQSAIDGYNVTIFAYGQTGAGKTFTLYGTPEQEGIAGRSIGHLFELLGELRKKHAVAVSASMVELYCGKLVDLLRPMRRGGSSPTNSPKLNLRTCHDGGTQVENLTEQEAKDVPELRRLLNRGLAARTVAAHSMNAD